MQIQIDLSIIVVAIITAVSTYLLTKMQSFLSQKREVRKDQLSLIFAPIHNWILNDLYSEKKTDELTLFTLKKIKSVCDEHYEIVPIEYYKLVLNCMDNDLVHKDLINTTAANLLFLKKELNFKDDKIPIKTLSSSFKKLDRKTKLVKTGATIVAILISIIYVFSFIYKYLHK